MDFEVKKQSLVSDELCQEISPQQNIETQITLPDYCGDIKKILKCILGPGISNLSVSGDRATATGKVSLRLIYVNDKDKIDCYEGSEDLSLSAVIKDLPENPVICAEAKTNYVNCRATSQRKISVEGSVAVIFIAYASKSDEFITDAHGKGVQCRKKQIQYESLISRKEKIFDLGETAKIPQGKATIGKILNISSRATLQSKKAVADKLLIKGDLYTDILYLSESEEGKIEKFTHSMPISQIIDIPGIDENSPCSVELNVKQVNVQRKADSSSQGSLAEISVRCSVMVRCSQVNTADVIDDYYSTDYDSKGEFTLQQFSFPVYTADEQKTSVCTVDMLAEVSGVFDIWCSDILSQTKVKTDKAKIHSKAVLGILYLDSKGKVCFTEKEADFDIDFRLRESYENTQCSCKLQMRDIEWKIIAKDKLEVKMKTGIICQVNSCESLRILRNINVSDKKKNSDDAALTLYFGSKNEKLWDIAKKYNTTIEAIQSENTLSGDVTEKDGMLLIPCI
jgi:hypothetical protein